MDCWTLIKDIVMTAAACLGVYAAFDGLSTWKKQIKGTHEYELARRLLLSLTKYRYAIEEVRNPFLFEEKPSDEEQQKMNAEEIRFQSIARPYEKRWNHVKTERFNLETDIIEAEVIWSDDFRKNFEKLFKFEVDLLRVVQNYLISINPSIPKSQRQAQRDHGKKLPNILYAENGEDSNKFSENVKSEIVKLKNILKKKYER